MVIRFPPRSIQTIVVYREHDDGGWLVARAHGWLFGSLADARREARWLSQNLGLPIREVVP